jgi:hypothetical protein
MELQSSNVAAQRGQQLMVNPRAPWIAPFLAQMVRDASPFALLDGSADVKLLDAGTTQLGHSSMGELVTLMMQSAGGATGTDTIESVATAAVVSDSAGAATRIGTQVAAFRIRLSASNLNWTGQPITINQGLLTNTAGTLAVSTSRLKLRVTPKRGYNVVDLLLLSVANAGGMYTTAVGGVAGTVLATETSTWNGIVISALSSSYNAMIEPVNQRDLIARRPGAPSLYDIARDYDVTSQAYERDVMRDVRRRNPFA